MNYPKLGNYQAGGMRKRRARKLKQRFEYLDTELKRGRLKGVSDKTGESQQFDEDTTYNRKIKAGMAGIQRKQRINEARAEVGRARKRKRVNRGFGAATKQRMKDELKTARSNRKVAKSQDFGRRKMRKEMVATGKGANLGPQGKVRYSTRMAPEEMKNYGKMKGGKAGFRGKAKTKKVR